MRRLFACLMLGAISATFGVGSCSSSSGSGPSTGGGSVGGSCPQGTIIACDNLLGPYKISACDVTSKNYVCPAGKCCLNTGGHPMEGYWDCYLPTCKSNGHCIDCPKGYDCGCQIPSADGGAAGGGGSTATAGGRSMTGGGSSAGGAGGTVSATGGGTP